MIKVIKAGIDADVAADMDAKVKATVETTLKDIESRGDAAVREMSEKFCSRVGGNQDRTTFE